jgi:hypothetical protein
MDEPCNGVFALPMTGLADVFRRGHPNQEITWRDMVFYKQFDSRMPRVFLLYRAIRTRNTSK